MQSAIKGRRGSMLNDMEENAHQLPDQKEQKPGGSADMQGLVQSLSDDQKSELMGILSQDMQPQKEVNAVSIQQGEMGPGEEAELAEYSAEGEQEDAHGGHESEDQIMESMISSADKGRVDQGAKPRNLGERVKMSLANKLKNKGKGS